MDEELTRIFYSMLAVQLGLRSREEGLKDKVGQTQLEWQIVTLGLFTHHALY